MNIFSIKPKAFGLDISDFSLRFAALEKQKDKIVVSSFGEEKIPDGVVLGGEIKDKAALAQIIKKSVANPKSGKIKTNFVVSSLPEEKSYLDVIKLPGMPPDETENAVRHEIENHIPLPLAEVYFGWEKIETPAGKKDFQEILIAAAPQKTVDDYLFVLKSAGLEAVGFEIECLAIVRSVLKEEELSSPTLIVDFGGSRTTFIFYSGRTVRFTSTIPFSSQGLTREIAEKLNIIPKDAEKLKIKHGLKGDKKIKYIIGPRIEKFADEIKNGLEYYRTHEEENRILYDMRDIEKIFLCGAAANLKGLVDFLEKRLKIDIALANPFSNISHDPPKNAPKLSFEKALSYATTLGLALRGIN